MNLMIIIKVKNLKTNSRLQIQKCQSFTQLSGGKAYVKPTLEIYVLQSVCWDNFQVLIF